MTRLLFLNRSYWPDAEATGQLLTELCEDLVPAGFDVTVIAGQPNHNPQGDAFRRRGTDVRHGVRIRRVWNSRFPKTSLPGRALNLLSYLCLATLAALRLRRPDVVIVETDPPLLCLTGALLRRFRGARLVIYLQDIYPDLAVALGKLPGGPLVRLLRRLMFAIYRRADRVIVLSRDMRDLLISEGLSPDRVICLPNWVDTSRLVPVKTANPFRRRHQLDGRFVVAYSGNMGLCQSLDTVIDAARLLAADPPAHRHPIHFLLIGDGAHRPHLASRVASLRLDNVTLLPYQPKADLAASLGAADLHLVPIDARVVSYLMPSKLYGILASATPLLAIAPDHCELADITRRHAVGRVVPPGDPAALADSIRWAAGQPAQLAAMGRRARALALSQYDRSSLTARFATILRDLALGDLAPSPMAPSPFAPSSLDASTPLRVAASPSPPLLPPVTLGSTDN